MFVDASAILARESGYQTLTDRLKEAARPITRGLAVFEAALAVARLQAVSLEKAETAVAKFLTEAGIILVPIAASETREALSAHARFGKGRSHPAKPNLGDCFAYACAWVHGVPLLFVGEDFPHTDIRPALA